MSETEGAYDDAVFAGEYVLGVLEADERARAAARARENADFYAMTRFWEDRLGPLAAEFAPLAPPPALKRRIMETVFAEEGHAKKPSPLVAAVNFWRLAAAGLAAIALIASAALLYFTMQPDPRAEPRLIASVLPADAAPVLQARIDERLRVLEIENAAIELAEDQAAELWLIPEDGTPRSLGLIHAQGRDRVEIPRALRALIAAGAALAVSLEPPGGSPTGAPTGPVIGVGQLSEY